MMRTIFYIILFTISTLSYSEMYINTSNLALKASLQNLSDAGHLNIPLTTYPIAWLDVKQGLKGIQLEQLSGNDILDYNYVVALLKEEQGKRIKLGINTSNKDMRFTSFGDDFRNKNNIVFSASDQLSNFSYKLTPSYSIDPLEDDKFQYNDSYFAVTVANWNLTVGTQDRWWGPGWDSNVSLTNNARPIPAISFSRNTSQPFLLPFTDSFYIPWNLTSFIGQMEKNRTIPHALLWGFRMSIKPMDNLEVSIVRLAQWGGDGRGANISTFWDVFLGKDNCGASGSSGIDCGLQSTNEPGNQQAGYDFRYSFDFFNAPFSLYGQYYAEDGNSRGGLNFFGEPIFLAGLDSHFVIHNYIINSYIEYADSFQACTESVPHVGNCIYEHHLYQTGMRYKLRNISNIYDNDAKSFVFGVIGQNYYNSEWDLKLRYIELNRDDLERYPGITNGNSVTEVAENMLMISGNYKNKIDLISYKVGASLSKSTYNHKKDDYDITAHISFSYNL